MNPINGAADSYSTGQRGAKGVPRSLVRKGTETTSQATRGAATRETKESKRALRSQARGAGEARAEPTSFRRRSPSFGVTSPPRVLLLRET